MIQKHVDDYCSFAPFGWGRKQRKTGRASSPSHRSSEWLLAAVRLQLFQVPHDAPLPVLPNGG